MEVPLHLVQQSFELVEVACLLSVHRLVEDALEPVAVDDSEDEFLVFLHHSFLLRVVEPILLLLGVVV